MPKTIDQVLEQQRISQRAYELNNKEKIRDYKRNYRLEHLDMYAEKERIATRQLRQNALDVLGNQCCRCGFDNWKALQIDHVNGGGHQERKKLGEYKMYKRVLQFSEDYQLLCANCNWIKRVDNGE